MGLSFVLVSLGVWARCVGFRSVFPRPGSVELLPADSHYYVRFALLQLRSFPRFTRFDSYVNYPTGAHVLWPPLHALGVAAAEVLGGIRTPERGAAWVGVAWSLLGLCGLAWLSGRTLGVARSWGVVALLAFIPACVWSGALGNADHHVHEPLVLGAALLAFHRMLEARSGGWAVVTGVILGLGRLLTPMAFIFIPLVAAALPLAAWLERRAAHKLGALGLRCAVSSAAVLGLGVLVWGEPSSLAYERLTWFHPLLALTSFGLASAGALWLGKARSSRWVLAGSLLGVAVLAPSLLRAARHLGRVDPLLAVVDESSPLWRDPRWAAELLGVSFALLPLALWGALRQLRQRNLEPCAPLIATLGLLLAAALQARFIQALAGAMAVLLPVALPGLLSPSLPWARRTGALLLGLGALSVLPQLLPARATAPRDVVSRTRPTLFWIRDHTPPASVDALSAEHPRYGIVASYLLGHLVNLWAERPAVASTFSQTDEHLAGNERASAVLAATTDDTAYAAAEATGARYVLVTPTLILGASQATPDHSLLTRLLDHAGMATPDVAASAHFQLVHDSAEQRLRPQGGAYARVFQVVSGALLAGHAAPGSSVSARASVRPDGAASMDYLRTGAADERGDFSLRVAYPGTYTVETRGVTLTAVVNEEQVEQGAAVDLTGR